jgi:hypothetical protein
MARAGAVAHVSLWAALLTLFICLTAPKIVRRVSEGSSNLVGDASFHSSDTLLLFATGTTGISDRLVRFFDSVPREQRILVLERNDDPASSLIAMLSAYLAWPHPVKVNVIRNKGDAIGTDSTPLGAIVFCRVKPPANLPKPKRFGDGLEILPVAMNQP